MLHLERAEISSAAILLTRATPSTDRVRFDLGWHDGMLSWLAILQGRSDVAVAHAARLVHTSNRSGSGHAHFMALLVQANAFAFDRQSGPALECISTAREANGTQMPVANFSADLIEADILHGAQDEIPALALVASAAWLAARGPEATPDVTPIRIAPVPPRSGSTPGGDGGHRRDALLPFPQEGDPAAIR